MFILLGLFPLLTKWSQAILEAQNTETVKKKQNQEASISESLGSRPRAGGHSHSHQLLSTHTLKHTHIR